MHKAFILFRFCIFLCLFSLVSCQQQTASQEEVSTSTQQENSYRVISIKDGDTIELLKDGKPLRVRLYGVDAPEKNQNFGTRARQFTSELVFGQAVQLQVKDTDRYGRTVGIIYLPDGRSLNKELVRAGFAWHYKAYSKDPALAALEIEAREARRGLWVDPSPTAPWDFRKTRRSGRKPLPASDRQETKLKSVTTSDQSGQQVFLCDSKGATTFHRDQDCRHLKNCEAPVISLSSQQARARARKACKTCAI